MNPLDFIRFDCVLQHIQAVYREGRNHLHVNLMEHLTGNIIKNGAWKRKKEIRTGRVNAGHVSIRTTTTESSSAGAGSHPKWAFSEPKTRNLSPTFRSLLRRSSPEENNLLRHSALVFSVHSCEILPSRTQHVPTPPGS